MRFMRLTSGKRLSVQAGGKASFGWKSFGRIESLAKTVIRLIVWPKGT